MNKMEAILSSVSVKAGKDSGSECVVKLKMKSEDPETDFSPLLSMIKNFVNITIEATDISAEGE